MKIYATVLAVAIMLCVVQVAVAQTWTVIVVSNEETFTFKLDGQLTFANEKIDPEVVVRAFGGKAYIDQQRRTITIPIESTMQDTGEIPTLPLAKEGGIAQHHERYYVPGKGTPFGFAFTGYNYIPSRCLEFPDGRRVTLCDSNLPPDQLEYMLFVTYSLTNLSNKVLNINNTFANFHLESSTGVVHQELGYQRDLETGLEVNQLLPGQEKEFFKLTKASYMPDIAHVYIGLRGEEGLLKYRVGVIAKSTAANANFNFNIIQGN